MFTMFADAQYAISHSLHELSTLPGWELPSPKLRLSSDGYLVVNGVRNEQNQYVSNMVWLATPLTSTGIVNDRVDTGFVKLFVYAVSEEHASFDALLPSVPFELAASWLHCATLGEGHLSWDVVAYFSSISAVGRWWESTRSSSLFNSDPRAPTVHIIPIKYSEIQRLSRMFMRAFNRSKATGIDISTCWDILQDRIVL